MGGAMEIESLFPGLAGTAYRRTSPPDLSYNCVAWAVGESERWWWPDPSGDAYWPTGLSRVESVDAFHALFRQLGFESTDDESSVTGVEKVALFANGGKPTHATRQLPNGNWTRKLGSGEDIEHPLRALEGREYGRPAAIYQRVISTP
jgi:hypothetical protein